jgi:glutaminase-like protein
MPNPNAIVSTSIRLDKERQTVELDDGRRARLDPEDPRSAGFASVLEGLSELRRPVYLEIDPGTSAIRLLLLPLVARVAAIAPTEDGLSVEIDPSHARHLVPRGTPDFDELERQLREAAASREPVVVTETDSHEIIDVRLYRPGPEGPPLPLPERKPLRPKPWLERWLDLLRRLFWWLCWPWWWWFRCISAARAQQVFNAMSATSCNPTTVSPPCIPFMYPDNGCWARAHEMCRLMINMGLSPRKVWISGRLHASTRNRPQCFVDWAWHVAPTLCVRGPGFFQTQRMVIDPSLVTGPVTEAGWKGVQGDPSATLTHTAASDYYWGSTDPGYVQTNADLAFYRLQLQNRSNLQGPPPYANCP